MVGGPVITRQLDMKKAPAPEDSLHLLSCHVSSAPCPPSRPDGSGELRKACQAGHGPQDHKDSDTTGSNSQHSNIRVFNKLPA